MSGGPFYMYTQGDLAGARQLQELVLETMVRLLGN